MNIDKQKRLEAHGWKIGSVEEFLGLSDEEKEEVEKHLDSFVWEKYLESETERKEVYVKLAKENIMDKLLRWTRKSDESLFLEVLEDDKWISYKSAKFYVPDALMSSNSGFATAQKYLNLGYQYVSNTKNL